jgi:chromate transporter
MEIAKDADAAPRGVSTRQIFLGFLKIGALGFGGVAPWARQVIVEEQGWLNDKEYAEVLGVGQILPGPNTMNAAIIIGDRFQGVAGIFAAILGQLAIPLVVVTSLSLIYDRFAYVPEVNAALTGAAAASAGLVLGTGLKMIWKIRPTLAPLAITAAAFLAVGILQWPLPPVVLVLGPLGIALASRR